MLTSCSKHTVEKKVPKPIDQPIEKIIPVIIEKEIPGIIPETIMNEAEEKYSIFSRYRYEAFNAKIRELQNVSIEIKLKEINNFFNKVPYADDIIIWNQKEYWATPLEFLGKDKGDCEDYVIAKYFALVNLGVESKKLYLSHVKSTRFKRSHMVLSYYKTPSSIPLILDNTNFKIFPADKRKDLTLVYNFNGENLCFTREAGHLNNTKVFSKWDTLINNIKINKF